MLTGPKLGTALIQHIPTWLNRPISPGWWLSSKANRFDWAYVKASYNMSKLKDALQWELMGTDRGASGVVMPKAPVVLMSFMGCLYNCNTFNGVNDGDFFTGICLAGANCTSEDFLPRNDSIWLDLLYPQMTDNQDAAMDALDVTGTQKFWADAAQANGIDKNIIEEKRQLAQANLIDAAERKGMSTESETFIWEVAITIVILYALLVIICFIVVRVIRGPKDGGKSPLDDTLTFHDGTWTTVPVVVTCDDAAVTPPTASAIGTAVAAPTASAIGSAVSGALTNPLPVSLPTATVTTITPPTVADIGEAVAAPTASATADYAPLTNSAIAPYIAETAPQLSPKANTSVVETNKELEKLVRDLTEKVEILTKANTSVMETNKKLEKMAWDVIGRLKAVSHQPNLEELVAEGIEDALREKECRAHTW